MLKKLLVTLVILSPFLSQARQGQEQSTPLSKLKDSCDRYGFLPKVDRHFFTQFKDWSTATSAKDSVEYYKKLVEVPEFKNFSQGVVRMAFSRSLQMPASTPDHPRLISYHSSGVIIALTDAPAPVSARFSQKMEGIRYDFENDTWEPFTGRMTPSGVQISTSTVDTKACFTCHGTPFRPIWRSYDSWPGQLSTMGGENYHEVDRFRPLTFSSASNVGQELMMYSNSFNYKRMHKELKQNPNWSTFRTAVVANLIGCTNIPEFIGPPDSPLRKKLDGTNRYATIKQEVEKNIKDTYEREREYSRAINDQASLRSLRQESELNDAERMTVLRYLFESSNTNVKAFAISRSPLHDGYGFNETGGDSGGVMNFLCQIIPEYVQLKTHTAQVLQWAPHESRHATPELCESLKKESLELTRHGKVPLLGETPKEPQ